MRRLSTVLLLWVCCVDSLSADQGISLAEVYQGNSQCQWRLAIESLERFRLNEEDQVLDVGCGDGKITAWIAERVPLGMVVGIDISKEMVAHASSRHGLPNLVFLEGDAAALPFVQQFDKVVSFSALHWVLDQEQGLRSLKASLKPGGQMLLAVIGKSPTNLGALAETVVSREKWIPYFPDYQSERVYYSPEEYLALLDRVGLEVQSMVVSEFVTTYPDKAALRDHLRPLLNFADHLPEGLRKEFEDDIVDLHVTEANLNYPDGVVGQRLVKIEIIAFAGGR